MNAVRIHRKLDSETLHLPELRPLIGKTVEIVVSDTTDAAANDEFYSIVGLNPNSEAEWEERQATFRVWRTDPRFQRFWAIIDHIQTVDFASVKRRAAALDAVNDLEDYDFDAYRRQRECDIKDAAEHMQ